MQNPVRIALTAALMISLAAGMGGCAQSQQVENQAYVIALGIDRNDSGELELSVQIPKVAENAAASSGGSGGASGSYIKASARASGYEDALEKLSWALPRDTNLSQLKLVAISRALAQRPEFITLLDQLMQTQQLSSSARLVICDGAAKEFVEALKPQLGTRLSADIIAGFEHSTNRGFIPDITLADFYMDAHSAYSTPVAICGYAQSERAGDGGAAQQPEDAPAIALIGTAQEESETIESESGVYYLGTALFHNGIWVGALDGESTCCLNLFLDRLESITLECGDKNLMLTGGPARVKIDTGVEPVRISVFLEFTLTTLFNLPDEAEIKQSLQASFEKVIRETQALGVEPFGLAEIAARAFPTAQAWADYDWLAHYRRAQVEINIDLSHADA